MSRQRTRRCMDFGQGFVQVVDIADPLNSGGPTFFWRYTQYANNQSIHLLPEKGIVEHVIIEARTADEANLRAENIGLYWGDDVANGDCDDETCCLSRWTRKKSDARGTERPCLDGGLVIPLSKMKRELPGLGTVEVTFEGLVGDSYLDDIVYDTAIHTLDENIFWFASALL